MGEKDRFHTKLNFSKCSAQHLWPISLLLKSDNGTPL